MAESNATINNKFSGNIDLSAIHKQRFTIDGDESRVLELNTSDLSIVTRLSETYPRLNTLSDEFAKLSEKGQDDESTLKDISDRLKAVDKEMRDCVDYIFDSNVSEMCAPSGSMYDPIGGQLRYEHITNILASLYEDNLSKEMKRVQNRMKSHTSKYIK